ncbi:hypothetical protein VNO80_23012 [Phaseolus coccineus]|uniref:Uncharacterized protein n=1 Tax=Phaseolus coccineus TaxID=3886 RepID=A0AAN9QUV6_PHACN
MKEFKYDFEVRLWWKPKTGRMDTHLRQFIDDKDVMKLTDGVDEDKSGGVEEDKTSDVEIDLTVGYEMHDENNDELIDEDEDVEGPGEYEVEDGSEND